ncbi:MAG TPA: phosphonate ABC transporter, permease protein PhnE [Cyanobacteria bacterium UBA8530]|nr:phosphonate ABC transporter, permease protein PhnE [Cyanobacteria bacterium UBA8530]
MHQPSKTAYPLSLPPKPKKKPLRKWALILVLLLVLAWAFSGSQFNFADLASGGPRMADMLSRSMPPDFSTLTDEKVYDFPPELKLHQLFLPVSLGTEQGEIKSRWWNNTFPQTILGATIQTIQMALTGTFLAVLFAFPLGFLAARNTSPHPLIYHTVKIIINFLRTIPDFAVGLILIAAIGLGPFAGTLALAFHTTTVLIKLFSESIENIDEGVVEAIEATGAHFVQIASFAVLPQVIPDFISFVLYRFETNIRAAAVLGLIGAGGIGLIMNSDFRMFQYPQAATSVLVLIVLVMFVDYTSARLRKMVL